MNSTKSPIASQTIIAGVCIVALAILQLVGVELSETDSAEAQGHAGAVIYGLLGLWAIFGRVRASKKIAVKPDNGRGLLFALCLCASVVIFSGCAATPTARWVQAREALTATQNVILIARRAGRIPDKRIVELDYAVMAARAALDAAGNDLPKGGANFDRYMAIALEVIERLSRIENSEPQTPNPEKLPQMNTDEHGLKEQSAGICVYLCSSVVATPTTKGANHGPSDDCGRPGGGDGGGATARSANRAGATQGRDHRCADGGHPRAGGDLRCAVGRGGDGRTTAVGTWARGTGTVGGGTVSSFEFGVSS
jgi:hypothetical protein